jgi:hypothetical protein
MLLLLLLLSQGSYAAGSDSLELSELWCEARSKWEQALGLDLASSTYACGEMSLQVCIGGFCGVKGGGSWGGGQAPKQGLWVKATCMEMSL